MKQAASFRESVRTGRNGNSGDTLIEVRSLATGLELPACVMKRAGAICEAARDTRLGQEFPRKVLESAALYVASREAQRPVTLKELAYASKSDPRSVGRCYVKLLEQMNISRPELNENEYVYHLTLKTPVSVTAMRSSQEIINSMIDKGLGGRNPMTLAAASLYIACCNLGENITQAEVAEAAGVGEQSVRDCCKSIRLLAKSHR